MHYTYLMPEYLIKLYALVPSNIQEFLTTPLLEDIFPIPVWVLMAGALVLLLMYNLIWLVGRPKYYFFVRHGQTNLNAERIRQGSEGGLTQSGIDQAERTGAFLEPFRIRKIYASPYERTRQTADIIAKHLHCGIAYSPLLEERHNPSEIIGKSTDDPNIKRIGEQIDLTFHSDDYRFSDEENFTDLKKRARNALRFLHRRPEHRICVVTHGIFLKMLVSYVLYGTHLHAPDWVRVGFFNPADNAGITLIVYRPWRRFSASRGWEVLSYNITIPTAFSDPAGQGVANLYDLMSR
jgi:probable phosphoglycerate mutase